MFGVRSTRTGNGANSTSAPRARHSQARQPHHGEPKGRSASSQHRAPRRPDTSQDIYNYTFSGDAQDVSFLETHSFLEIRCKIQGIPRPAYHAAFVNHQTGRPHAYNPHPGFVTSFENALSEALANAPFAFDLGDNSKPVELSVNFYFSRPKTHYLYDHATGKSALPPTAPHFSTKVPDIDNCIKLVMDALRGKLYRDDRCVASLKSHQLWFQRPGSVYQEGQDKEGATIFRLTQFKSNVNPCAVAHEQMPHD
mgnify:CR=1 FL=1